ncbi:MAG: protein kinase, partial [Burkholderiales bacterium]|nr:protein kinase [Anaerolineae bacterium]
MAVDNLSGQRFGVYHLRELIGSGGMGAVYHAYQTNLERDVALKVLPAALLIQPNYTQRFFREAKIAASLEHPHIVPVYDYGTHEGISYVVMRLLNGGTLSQRMFQRTDHEFPLPSCAEIAHLLTQLASALDYAHGRGVIHRDIKPSNIMFDAQGTAYVVDFGIAKLVGETTSLTDTGITIGTPSHMAPEQWTDEPIAPEIDQYALAVVIYNLLTGKLPFEATTPQAFMYKHLHEQAVPPHSLRDEVPPATEPVLRQALAKSPDDRFETVTAFAQAFAAAVAADNGQRTGFFTFPVDPMPIVLTSIKDTETDSEKAWRHAPLPLASLSTLPIEKPMPPLDEPASESELVPAEATLEHMQPVSLSPQTPPHAPQYAPPEARALDGVAPASPATLTTIPPVTIPETAPADATAPRRK